MENDTSPPTFVSFHDFDIIRGAFKASVAGGSIRESDWHQHARDLVHTLTGHDDPDEDMIRWIVGR